MKQTLPSASSGACTCSPGAAGALAQMAAWMGCVHRQPLPALPSSAGLTRSSRRLPKIPIEFEGYGRLFFAGDQQEIAPHRQDTEPAEELAAELAALQALSAGNSGWH